MIRRVVMLVCVASLLVSLFCVGGCGKSGQKESTLKIGALLSLTGPGSFWGQAYKYTFDMAAQEINDQGPLKIGDTTYDKIEMVYYDDKYTATEAVAGIKSLVEVSGVQHVLGVLGSPAMIAIADYAESNNILVLGSGSTPDRIGPTKPHIFAMFPSAKEMQPAVMQYVATNYPKAKTWYGIVPNNETGWSDIQVCGPRIKAQGWQILGWELYDPTTTDFYPLLTKIMAKNPDMIDAGSSGPGALSLIWKQLGELDYSGLKLAFSGMSPQGLLKAAGPDGVKNGIMSWFDFQGNYILDSEKEFQANLAAFSGKTPGVDFDAYSAMGAYDYVYVLIEAMKGAKTTDPTELAEYIQDMQYQAPDGLITFGGVKTFGIKRMIQKDIMVGYWQDGQYNNAQRIHVEVP